VDQLNLARVEEFLELKQDLWKYSKAKAKVLEDRKKELSARLAKRRGALEDRRMQAFEEASSLLEVESCLQDIQRQETTFQQQVCFILHFTI
jgi:hypothetical protein